jgi:hypothetical protein
MNNNVRIFSGDNFVTPTSVQQAIIDRFALSKNKDVHVKESGKEYDVYQNEKYVCSFDSSGNES